MLEQRVDRCGFGQTTDTRFRRTCHDAIYNPKQRGRGDRQPLLLTLQRGRERSGNGDEIGTDPKDSMADSRAAAARGEEP